MIRAAAALLPVVLFLWGLHLMDSFKLLRPRQILGTLGMGAAIAAVSLAVEDTLLARVPSEFLVRYLGPVIEEAFKAAPLVLLISTRQAGFLVDAAVQGFAVGAGFALVENAVYLRHLQDASIALWVVRGVGTAVLHGSTTAILAMVSKSLVDRHPDRLAVAFLPGLAAAIVIHSAFNHLVLNPVIQTLVLLAVLPPLLVWVFERSEHATRDWVGAGLDLDIELLRLIASEDFALTKFGQYLQELRDRFPGVVLANMYCLLRLEIELGVQAKASVMARSAGLNLPLDDDLRSSLAECDYLERTIGRTGLLTLRPLQVRSHRDRWHRSLLKGA